MSAHVSGVYYFNLTHQCRGQIALCGRGREFARLAQLLNRLGARQKSPRVLVAWLVGQPAARQPAPVFCPCSSAPPTLPVQFLRSDPLRRQLRWNQFFHALWLCCFLRPHSFQSMLKFGDQPKSTWQHPEPPIRRPWRGFNLPPRIPCTLTPVYPGAPHRVGNQPAERVPSPALFGAVEAILRSAFGAYVYLKTPGRSA